MGRVILASIQAPIVWGVVCVPINLLLMSLYGDRVDATVAAAELPVSYLTISLVLGAIGSITAGYCAALIAAGRIRQAGFGAGLALLAVGIPVQLGAWETLPVWYHLVFLTTLLPFGMLGARLRDGSQAGVASS